MLTWLRHILFGAALLCLLVMGALYGLEQSGVLVRLVRERATSLMGPLGSRITMEHIELRWFEPGIIVHGLSLAPAAEAEASDLHLERVHVTLSWRLGAMRLDAIDALHIEGGGVLLSPRLLEDWNSLAGQGTGEATPVFFPAGSMRGLKVSLQLASGAPFELGTLDLCARPGRDGAIEIAGQLAPSLGGAITAREPIRVRGTRSAERVRLWASARALELETTALPSALPRGLPLDLPVAEGSGRLTLDSYFELAFGESAKTSGRLRASLVGGRAQFHDAQWPTLEKLDLELDATLDPAPGHDYSSHESWEARGALTALIGTAPFRAWAEFGRGLPDGAWAHAWGGAKNVPTDPGKLWIPSMEPQMAFAREMLAPHGVLDLGGTMLLGGDAANLTWDLAMRAHATGGMGLSYQGFPGDPDSGLALPLKDVRGELLFGSRSGAERPWRFAGLSLSADHGSGRVGGWVQVTAARRAQGAYPWPELDIVLSSASLSIDEELRDLLAQNRYLEWIGPTFEPMDGTLAGEWRLRSGPELGGLSSAGTVRLNGVSMRWSEVPVQMDGVAGELSVLWGPWPSSARGQPLVRRRPLGVEYRFDNRDGPRVGAAALVKGWLREEDLAPIFEPASLPLDFPQEIHVQIEELGLRGRDFDVLAARFPALEREVADYGAVGRMKVLFKGAQPALELPFRSTVEATPIEVHVRPQFFQRQTRNLRGRVLVRTEEIDGVDISASQFVLTGSWPGKVELSTRGTVPLVGEAQVHVFGAGIDPNNTSFKGALTTSLATTSPDIGEIDLSAWTLEGPVDFALDTSFDPASPEPATNRFRIQLRDNDWTFEDLVLNDLHGTFVQDDEVMTSDLMSATLAGHPIELRNVSTFTLAALDQIEGTDPWLSREGFWTDPQGRAMQADLSTLNLPLDVAHLTGILDPETLDILRDNPGWRGKLDIDGARMVITSEFDDQGKVAIRGSMLVHDLSMQMGIPIRVESAHLEVVEGINEDGRVRGWANITELDALLAERELSNGSMIAGYVDGRLTIDNLSGDFEGGRLESLGGVGGGSSKAVGVDLSEPYRFDVAIRLKGVQVDGLLRGVFQSSIADEGVLDASLQLSGTPSEVLALTGRGSLNLDEGALWSIPVIRALFAQLGFDRSGLFDRLRLRFELRDGRISIPHMKVRSNLLDLVGEGWQDLDGQLSYDLRVRYGLLDRLGVFGRLLYWFNNNLMRVAVRGDFERPSVTIRNSILEIFLGFEDDPPRYLPLPRFSTLGPRF